MSTPPKRPKTVNRLQQLITEWERESGQPVRRLNLRVASMMLAGALRRAVDDDGAVVFVTRGGVAMELRAGKKARVTGDVDLVLRGDPESLLAHLDASLAEDYEEFSFERSGENPRYWDLIDLQLLQALTGGNLSPVKDACQRIFTARGQQPWPPHITTYPDWSDRYATMASGLDMPITDLNEAVEVVHALIQAIDTS